MSLKKYWMCFFMPEIPLPLQKVEAELCAGINEGIQT
jgi:hypothetical protein